METLLQFVLLIIGFAMLMKGADWFVDGAAGMADLFGIPQLVIGLTIAAIGTSLPEAAVSITSALHGNTGITIGNVVGSNILNILIILGLTAVVCPVPVQKSTVKYEIPFTIGVTVLLVTLGLWDGTISRIDGGILWLFMALYMVYLLKMAKSGGQEAQKQEEKTNRISKLLLLVLVGIVLIKYGSDITVNAATAIATSFGMTERLIGLTIVAFGTSLPELVTSVTAATKGKTDIAVGNIVGSNIFNILFVVGTTAVITPVEYSSDFRIDSFTAIGAAVLLLVCVFKKKRLGRIGGAVMLAGYGAYFIYLIR